MNSMNHECCENRTMAHASSVSWRVAHTHVQMPSRTTRAHFAMMFVMSTFSLWNVLGEAVLSSGTDPIVFALFREAGTALVLCVACLLQLAWNGRVPIRPGARQALLFVVCGMGGVYALQCFFILGLAETDANTGALFQPLTPVLVLFFAALLGLEPLSLCASRHGPDQQLLRRSWQKVGGVLLASGGCVLVVEVRLRAARAQACRLGLTHQCTHFLVV